MAADLRLSIAVALQRANRALKAVEEIKRAAAKGVDIAFKVVGADLVVTTDGQEQSLGRVAGEDGEDGESVSLEDVRRLVAAWLQENIKQPEHGRNATPEQIAEAVDVWADANRESLKGEDGKDADHDH